MVVLFCGVGEDVRGVKKGKTRSGFSGFQWLSMAPVFGTGRIRGGVGVPGGFRQDERTARRRTGGQG